MKTKLKTMLAAMSAAMCKCNLGSRTLFRMLCIMLLTALATIPTSAIANVSYSVYADEVAVFEEDIISHFNAVMSSDVWDEVPVLTGQNDLAPQTYYLASKFVTTFDFKDASYDEPINTPKACLSRLSNNGEVTNIFASWQLESLKRPVYWISVGYKPLPIDNIDIAYDFVVSNIVGDSKSPYLIKGIEDVASNDEYSIEGTFSRKKYKALSDKFYIFWIDDQPNANWRHPARCVFLDKDLTCFVVHFANEPITVSKKGVEAPFRIFTRDTIEDKETESSIDDVRGAQNALFTESNGISFAGDASNSYAILISGGANIHNNHTRYWGDMAAVYSTLTKRYGMPKSNIKVCMSDGASTGVDLASGSTAYYYDDYGNKHYCKEQSHSYFSSNSSPLDLDGDNVADVEYDALKSTVQNVFFAMKNKLTSSDQLFVFVTDHGGYDDDTGLCYLCLWNQQQMSPTEFAAMTSGIKCPIAFAMEFCYSGAFIQKLKAQPNRVIATAAGVEPSSAYMTTPQLYYMNPWVFYFVSAMRGAAPSMSVSPWNDVSSVYVDPNGDGFVSVQEAANYAKTSIMNYSITSGGTKYTYPETPQYESVPSDLGDAFFFVRRLSARVAIAPDAVAYTASSNTGSFSVTSSDSWTVSKPSSSSWITLKTTSGSGNGTVSYSVAANTTGKERTGTIVVTCGSDTATHTITQSAEAVKLSVSPATVDVSNSANNGSFSVAANYSWAVTTSASWITLNNTSGSGNGTISYSVSENAGGQRAGTITVTSGSLTATHTVTQAAPPQLSIDPSVNNCTAAASQGSFRVTSDSMWTVTTSATWIRLNTVSGSGNGTVTYSIDENTGNSRQGFIYVTSGSVKSTHMVAQTRMEGITFVPSSQSVNVSGSGDTGTFTFTVMGNTRIVSLGYSQVDWASWSFSREDITEGAIYTCTYTVNANTTYGTRSVKIPITFNGEEYDFTITQGIEVNYLVTYRPGALGTGSETYDIKQKNVSLKLRRDIFTRTDDYEQSGWATSDGGGKVYDLGAAYTENASITLYPYWTPKTIPNETYNIYLRPGSHGEGKEQTLIKTKGVTLTLPGALYKRVGYEQTGWSQAISGSSKTYDLGGKYTKDVMTYLYPYWTKVEEESFEADFGFYRPNGWKSPVYLCTTNTEWWTYVPQYVFSQDDSLRLNYCINNYSETQTVNVNNRLISLLAFDGEVITSVSESFDGVIQPLYMMHYRTSNVESWLSQCAPGNYAIKMTLDPDDELNDIDKSDNAAIQWFAVKADGVSYNEALDCTSLWFEADSDEFAPFAQTSVSVTGGSCLQFGPQPTNSYGTVLWGYVTEPGRLSFKWKALGNDYKNCMVFYVGDEMKTWKWGGQGDWETSTIEISESDVASGYVWISWKLWTYDADMSVLSVGWLDNVVWNPTGRKPTFTVSNDGKLTKIVLNGVTDLEIPSMVNSIAVRSIGYCALTNTAITSLSIPNTVTNIEPFAFWRNDKLSGVTIPGSVLMIGENAFGDCKAIKSIQIEEGVETIGNYAFYGCDSVMTVGIPASVVNICQSPFGKCLNLRTITVANDNSRYEILNHALVDKTSMTLAQYPSGCIESKYIISDGITSIGYDAFDSVSYLTNVTLPESVTSLDRFAFYMCSNLNVLTFKGDAPSVGDYAFLGVSSLCKAMVSPQSSGWGVPIPGTWQGLDIEYSAALQRYSVTYNPGACGIGIQMSETKSYGITLPLKGAIFTRIGYSQTGWSTSDGGAKVYELGASYTTNAAVTLYPYWEANTYGVAYELDGGEAGADAPSSADYGTAFCVSAPTRDGYVFMGWMVTVGLDITTARYGESVSNQSTEIGNASQQCFNGSDVDVWFINLTPVADGNVTLTATWEPVPDDSRDIGFYAPASKGWSFPVCLSSTNINYLAYAPETEFVQFSDVFLSFCAVNWSTAGSAMLQSTLLTITDESGAVFDQGEPILVKSLGAFGYAEVRNLSMRRYMSGIAPGHYKLTLELDPNRLLVDPDLSNNITSIWFTVVAPIDPIPELPSDATAADVRVALADSVDGRLAENISDVPTYTAYREWARGAKGADGNPAGVESVKSSNKAWFSFAVDSSELIEKEIVGDDVKIEEFAMASDGGQFDFTVGITDVTIGDGATTARLKTIFGVEGATKLEDSAFSTDNLTLETAEPEFGKVKLTVKPPAPKTSEEDSHSVFFMRVKVND